MFDNILDGDDGIGALGNGAAGRDPHRLSALQGSRHRPAGSDPRHHGEPARRVGRPHGVAVHRRARERRQIDGRPGGLGQYAAGGGFQPDRLGRKWPSVFEDQALGLRH